MSNAPELTTETGLTQRSLTPPLLPSLTPYAVLTIADDVCTQGVAVKLVYTAEETATCGNTIKLVLGGDEVPPLYTLGLKFESWTQFCQIRLESPAMIADLGDFATTENIEDLPLYPGVMKMWTRGQFREQKELAKKMEKEMEEMDEIQRELQMERERRERMKHMIEADEERDMMYEMGYFSDSEEEQEASEEEPEVVKNSHCSFSVKSWGTTNLKSAIWMRRDTTLASVSSDSDEDLEEFTDSEEQNYGAKVLAVDRELSELDITKLLDLYPKMLITSMTGRDFVGVFWPRFLQLDGPHKQFFIDECKEDPQGCTYDAFVERFSAWCKMENLSIEGVDDYAKIFQGTPGHMVFVLKAETPTVINAFFADFVEIGSESFEIPVDSLGGYRSNIEIQGFPTVELQGFSAVELYEIYLELVNPKNPITFELFDQRLRTRMAALGSTVFDAKIYFVHANITPTPNNAFVKGNGFRYFARTNPEFDDELQGLSAFEKCYDAYLSRLDSFNGPLNPLTLDEYRPYATRRLTVL